MKKRLTKKWLNRYINPLIKDLKQVYTYEHFEDEPMNEQQTYRRVYKNVTIVNGYAVEEGHIYPASSGMRSDIIRARNTLIKYMERSHKTFIRLYPRWDSKRLRMRILVEHQ